MHAIPCRGTTAKVTKPRDPCPRGMCDLPGEAELEDALCARCPPFAQPQLARAATRRILGAAGLDGRALVGGRPIGNEVVEEIVPTRNLVAVRVAGGEAERVVDADDDPLAFHEGIRAETAYLATGPVDDARLVRRLACRGRVIACNEHPQTGQPRVGCLRSRVIDADVRVEGQLLRLVLGAAEPCYQFSAQGRSTTSKAHVERCCRCSCQ